MNLNKLRYLIINSIYVYSVQIVVALSLAALLITIWFNKVAKIEKEVKLLAHNINQEFISEISNAAALFSPNNASSINLARILSFSLQNNDSQFSNIESKVVVMTFFFSSF